MREKKTFRSSSCLRGRICRRSPGKWERHTSSGSLRRSMPFSPWSIEHFTSDDDHRPLEAVHPIVTFQISSGVGRAIAGADRNRLARVRSLPAPFGSITSWPKTLGALPRSMPRWPKPSPQAASSSREPGLRSGAATPGYFADPDGRGRSLAPALGYHRRGGVWMQQPTRETDRVSDVGPPLTPAPRFLYSHRLLPQHLRPTFAPRSPSCRARFRNPP